jgi:hypothetical protein
MEVCISLNSSPMPAYILSICASSPEELLIIVSAALKEEKIRGSRENAYLQLNPSEYDKIY